MRTNQVTRSESDRHHLLGKLASLQACLQVLEARASLSAEQAALVAGALQIVYELADLVRAAFPEAEPDPDG